MVFREVRVFEVERVRPHHLNGHGERGGCWSYTLPNRAAISFALGPVMSTGADDRSHGCCLLPRARRIG